MNTVEPMPTSPAARRMRRHRKRRAEGLRCVTILIRETDVDVLVGRGWLKPEMRNIRTAISNAVHELLDEIVSAVP
jgi:cytochrome oxidase assembly protein ShyY1